MQRFSIKNTATIFALAFPTMLLATHFLESCAQPKFPPQSLHQTLASQPPLSVVFDSPPPNTTASSLQTFSAHYVGDAGVARFELQLGGIAVDSVQPDSGAATVTTDVQALFHDGDYSARWIARDALGTDVGESARIPISVRTLTPITAPGVSTYYSVLPGTPIDGSTVSGTISLGVQAGWQGLPQPGHNILFDLYIDGAWNKWVFGTPISWDAGAQGDSVGWIAQVDTTTIPNGFHSFTITAYSEFQNPDIFYYTLRRELDVENTTAKPYALVPSFSDLSLVGGQTTSISTSVVMTDGTSRVAVPSDGVAWNLADSNDPNVVIQSSPGTFMPWSYGSTAWTVTATSLPGLSATTHIRVQPDKNVSHLSKNGKTLHAYDPTQSTFLRTLFFSAPGSFSGMPSDIAQRLLSSGVNALTMGFYPNPADSGLVSPGKETMAQWSAWTNPGNPSWLSQAIAYESPNWTWATSNGFNIWLTGDDVSRSANEQLDTANNSWAVQAIQGTISAAQSAGNVVGIDVIDEVDMILGITPCGVGSKVVQSLRTSTTPANLGFPIRGGSSPLVSATWLGDPGVSDHLTYYWTILDRRPAYDNLPSTAESIGYMLSSYYGRQPFIQNNISAPFIFETQNSMAWNSPDLWTGNFLSEAKTASAEIMTAVAIGAAGVRVYGFDSSNAKSIRQRIQASMTSTGWTNPAQEILSDPYSVGVDRWASMSAAFNLIAKLEPYILGQRANAIGLPGPVLVGARGDGKTYGLLIVVNESDESTKEIVNLTPYQLAGSKSVTRYRLPGDGTTVTENLFSGATQDTVTMNGSESIVWLIQ